jgi:hypothetical protein
LAGNQLRVIVKRDTTENSIRWVLKQSGVTVQAVHAGELNLEDVFIHLVKERA